MASIDERIVSNMIEVITNVSCPHCKKEIILEGTVGIYPEDTIEFVDVKFKKF